jgi:dGTPase
VYDLPPGPVRLLGKTGSRRIDALVHDLVESSERAGDIVQSPTLGEAMLELRAFLFARVYEQGQLREETERAAFVVRTLFEHYCTIFGADGLAGDALAEAVIDQIAGMTDRFAVRRFREVCEPKAWSIL